MIHFVRDLRGVRERGEAVEEIALAPLERPEREVVVAEKQRGAKRGIDVEFRFFRRVGEGVVEGFFEIFLRVLLAFETLPALARSDALVLAGRGEERARELLGGERALGGDGEKFLGRILRARGEQARALVRLREREFVEEPFEIELVRGEFAREQIEQLGMRRGIVAVVQIERLDEAAAHELPPDAIGDVAREERVLRRRELLREFLERAEFRHAGRARFLVRRHGPQLVLRRVGQRDLDAEGHARAGRALRAAEDGDELVFVGH